MGSECKRLRDVSYPSDRAGSRENCGKHRLAVIRTIHSLTRRMTSFSTNSWYTKQARCVTRFSLTGKTFPIKFGHRLKIISPTSSTGTKCLLTLVIRRSSRSLSRYAQEVADANGVDLDLAKVMLSHQIAEAKTRRYGHLAAGHGSLFSLTTNATTSKCGSNTSRKPRTGCRLSKNSGR